MNEQPRPPFVLLTTGLTRVPGQALFTGSLPWNQGPGSVEGREKEGMDPLITVALVMSWDGDVKQENCGLRERLETFPAAII